MKNDNGDYVVFVYIVLSLVLCFIISLFTPIGASPITILREICHFTETLTKEKKQELVDLKKILLLILKLTAI